MNFIFKLWILFKKKRDLYSLRWDKLYLECYKGALINADEDALRGQMKQLNTQENPDPAEYMRITAILSESKDVKASYEQICKAVKELPDYVTLMRSDYANELLKNKD